MSIQGLRTVIFHVPDLDRAKRWYAAAFGVQPYYDEPYYVGFNIGGFELGLDPDPASGRPGAGGSVAYWGVADIDAAFTQFIEAGGKAVAPVREVGGDIKVATVADPFGNEIGLVYNPHFVARHD